MTAGEAQRYHRAQVQAFAGTDVDLVSLLTVGLPGRGDRVRAEPPRGRGCRRWPRSPSRSTAGCRTAPRSARPSTASTTRPTGRRLLHGQLRPPEHVRPALDARRPWARAAGRRARQRLARSHAELDEADRAGRREPGGAGRTTWWRSSGDAGGARCSAGAAARTCGTSTPSAPSCAPSSSPGTGVSQVAPPGRQQPAGCACRENLTSCCRAGRGTAPAGCGDCLDLAGRSAGQVPGSPVRKTAASGQPPHASECHSPVGPPPFPWEHDGTSASRRGQRLCPCLRVRARHRS